MKVGLFGGTFNPIHNGHLVAIKQIKSAFRLSTIYFIPSFLPPHKSEAVSAEHRVAMVELAIAGTPSWKISRIEVDKKGVSYSIDTLQYFISQDKGAELYFILGSDSFNDIATWKDSPHLFELTHFIVLERPGYLHRSFDKIFSASQFKKFHQVSPQKLRHISGHEVTFFPGIFLPISSSDIRRSIKTGKVDWLDNVPEKVREYIKGQGLYKEEK